MNLLDKAINIFNDSIVWDNSIVWAERIQSYDNLDYVISQKPTVISLKLNPIRCDFAGTILALANERLKVKKDNRLMLINSIDDVYKAKKEDKIGITFSLPGSTCMETPNIFFDDEPFMHTEALISMGVTHMILTTIRNPFGDGVFEENDSGLSNMGKMFIKYMNKQPLIIDGTMCSYKTTMEAMNLSEKPFIFSHSNPSTLCKNIRNINDEQIKSCSKTGGVIGITFIGGYLGEAIPTVETVFKNIDYICQLTGSSKYTGFGTNFLNNMKLFWKGVSSAKKDGEICEGICFDYSKIAELIEVMLNKGYDEIDIKNILGENWIRVFKNSFK